MAVRFADRMGKVEGSAIRELLKLTARPEVISFAGGMPAPELFPVEEMKKVSVAVLEEQGKVALQYTTTEGYLPLREKIAQRMNKTLNTNVKPDDILSDYLQKGFSMSVKRIVKQYINQGKGNSEELNNFLSSLDSNTQNFFFVFS